MPVLVARLDPNDVSWTNLSSRTAPELAEATARRLTESMAIVLQGALLIRHGHPAVADAFAATRLAGDRGRAYGTLPSGAPTADIIARAMAS